MSTVFVTGNQHKAGEVTGLLAGCDVTWRKLALAGVETAELGARARARVLEAHAQLGQACFLETTRLELDGQPPMSGAAFKQLVSEHGELEVCRLLGGKRGRACVAVAYTADGQQVTVFEGDIEGTLLREPRGTGGYGWDRMWLPDGYQHTLGELEGHKCFVNMRHRPYLELADLLRGRTFGGSFEAHITIAPAGPDGFERFRASCARLEVKCLDIMLAQGENRSQPMTASYHHGTLREVQDEVQELARALAKDGLEVTRLKIEAMSKNRDIPESDAEARALPEGYFEYHLKILLAAGVSAVPLAADCQRHGAYLSVNARKLRDDGASEHFVTLRVPNLGRAGGEARFQALCDELAAHGHIPIGRAREYTVYDSNAALDRGWL